MQSRGKSTFGALVDDRFERKDGKASWRSATEQGSVAVTGPALYVPLNSSFTFTSLAISALAGKPDASLPLLPSGALKMRTVDQMDVAINGKTQSVQLLAMTGLGLSPSFAWATTGPKPRMFAFIIRGYFNVTEQGWHGAAAALEKRQKVAESSMLVDVAQRLQHPLKGLTVVRNARIFDSDKASVGQPSDVYVLRGRITAVLPAGSPVRADHEIDAAGRITPYCRN